MSSTASQSSERQPDLSVQVNPRDDDVLQNYRRWKATQQGPPDVSGADMTPVYVWLIKGLLGGVNLLAGMMRSGVSIAPHWLSELDAAVTNLDKLIDSEKQRQGL